MDPGRLVHWSALLMAIFGLLAALGHFVDALSIFVVLAGVPALIGFVLLLVDHRRVPTNARPWTFGAATVALLWVVAVLFLMVLANPIALKGEPGVGFNQEPSAWVEAVFNTMSTLMLALWPSATAAGWWPLMQGLAQRLLVGGAAASGALLIIGAFILIPGPAFVGFVVKLLIGAGHAAIGASFIMTLRAASSPLDQD